MEEAGWGREGFAGPQTARRDGPCGVTLAADSEIRHLSQHRSTAAPPWRPVEGGEGRGCGSTISLSMALHAKWREGSVSYASINSPSQQPRRISIQYIFMSLSLSLSLSPIAPAAPLHVFLLQKKKKTAHPAPPLCPPHPNPSHECHTAPLCIRGTAAQKQHQQVSRSSHQTIMCVHVCVYAHKGHKRNA